jgi:NAD(P)-dependent dehydrogenase (short-subunit alcohol dehydrogenase family)
MQPEQSQRRVAIVTAASEGIGKAIAISLLQKGCRVILVSRNIEKLNKALVEQSGSDSFAWFYPADMTVPSQVSQMIEAVIKREGKVDILVNNLGQGLRRELIDTSDQEWDHLVSLNLSSSFYASRAVLPHMRAQKQGWIINIASRAGRRGEGQFAAYSALKHGLVGLTHALADSERKFGIKVNAICPGPVATERMVERYPTVDLSSWSTPGDVAQAVLFLLSPAAAVMNGQCIDLFDN